MYFLNSPARSHVFFHMMVRASHDTPQSCDGHGRLSNKSLAPRLDPFIFLRSLANRTTVMEFVYVLGNSVSLNRKIDAPRTARDEKRRATHNEGMNSEPSTTRFNFYWKTIKRRTRRKFYSLAFISFYFVQRLNVQPCTACVVQ